MRRPDATLEIRIKFIFLSVLNNFSIYSFLTNLTNNRKETNKALVFSYRTPPPTLLNKGNRDESFQHFGKQNVQVHSSSELPIEYNQGQAP